MRDNWKKDFVEALIKNDVIGAQNLVSQMMPKKLYRYHSISTRTIIGLEKESVWVSDPSTFNDPYDSAAALYRRDEDITLTGWDESGNEIKYAVKDFTGLGKTLRKYDGLRSQKYADEIRKSLRVCCFSQNKNSVLMWSHYADQHKGICVEYDFTGLEKDELMLKWMYPVVYSKSLFGTPISDVEKIKASIGKLFSLHKHKIWSYEREWRLIIDSGSFDEQYIKIPKPTAIYLGSRINREEEIFMSEFAYRKKIRLFRSTFDPLNFRMIFSEISLKRSGDK
ncbi:DUF2971 domain-containing protein [Dyadobacter sp. CY323]|uniref:DUF2971 domain-containing protein n=1 Tax=Dyadobacter sp. CY323 TaxID=2907302 RepID=UPI001F257C75|nr:DUF2971 domain-containing protein [Dyadobacter sp. CY323]MCE6993069.1 DUF2971 domain-containing protein [Dyadobacter sp. CY323]